jgi:hypothetical protein
VTAEGRIIGTVAYMSPEQAEGKPVDPRSDVFSLGILLHEAATGERPFQGDTSLSIITSILRDTPQSVPQLNRKMPRQLGRIVKRCLAKEPSRRYQSAIGLRNELEELRDEMASGELEPAAGAAMTPARTNRPRLIATGLVGAAALVALGYGLSRWIAPGARSTLPTEPTFTKLTDLPGSERGAELSPDGKSLVYASRHDGDWDLYLQRVGGHNPINLTADADRDDTQPAFSPDGESIAFRSEREGGGLFVMGATGESVRRLTDSGHNPAWSPDGRQIAFGTERIFDTPRGRTSVSGETRCSRVGRQGDGASPSGPSRRAGSATS